MIVNKLLQYPCAPALQKSPSVKKNLLRERSVVQSLLCNRLFEGKDMSARIKFKRNSIIQKLKGPSIKNRKYNSVKFHPVTECSSERKRLAVFVSGNGSNFKALHKSCKDNKINGDIVCVISSKCDCGAVTYALSEGLPVFIYPPIKPGKVNHPLIRVLNTDKSLEHCVKDQYSVDFVLLAGYMKLVPSILTKSYERRMLNIHPALLPGFGGKGFYGDRVHEAVIRSGTRISGPTVHFVDSEYDKGKILSQRIVEVQISDTPEILAERVLRVEHEIYSHCVSALCADRIFWREDGIPWIWELH